MPRLFLFFVLLSIPFCAFSAIYKCTGPDESVTFSDKPCASDAEKVDVDPASGSGNEEAEARARARTLRMQLKQDAEREAERKRKQKEAAAAAARREANKRTAPGIAKCPGEDAVAQAIHDHHVVKCMTKDEVQESTKNQKHSGHATHQVLLDSGISVEEWYYQDHRSDWPRVIWFRSGKVTGIRQ